MFFRNLTLFRFSPAVAEDLSRLDEVLAARCERRLHLQGGRLQESAPAEPTLGVQP